MKLRIPYLSRLLEIKEVQLELEVKKIQLLNLIHTELQRINGKLI